MSGSFFVGTAITPFVMAATGALQAVFVRYPRFIAGSLGMIIPDAAVEEVGRDDLQITEHPVEGGVVNGVAIGVISDHAFKKPREVTLRWSWTESGRGEGFSQLMYDALLRLQASRTPFSLYTGKSSYRNMMIASLSATTNAASEYSLVSVMVCREVIIVSTQTVALPSQAAQSDPKNTSSVQSRGSVAPVPVS